VEVEAELGRISSGWNSNVWNAESYKPSACRPGKRCQKFRELGNIGFSGYEAMILTPEQAYAIVCNLREPERTLTLLPPAQDSVYRNAWACNGMTSISLTE
jgi:hypothetical protein